MTETNTIQTDTHHDRQFDPGAWLLSFRAIGGAIAQFGDMYSLQFPETGDDTLIELHNALTIEQRQRLNSFLQAQFGGEA